MCKQLESPRCIHQNEQAFAENFGSAALPVLQTASSARVPPSCSG